MSIPVALVVSVLLLATNAFFVGAEFAVTSARRSQIEPLALQGKRSAKTAMWALEHVSQMLAAAQLGVTVASTSLGAVAEHAVAELVNAPLVAIGLPSELSHVIAFVIALVLVVYLHVVAGEMIPKNLAISASDRAILYFGPPLVWISKVFHPVIVVLNWTANHFIRLFKLEPKDEIASAYTAAEVASIVELSQEEGVLQDEDNLLAGAIEFSEKTAADVMVPLDKVVSLPLGVTPEEYEKEVARTGFSRFPVTDTAGEVLGYLHLKDVLDAEPHQRTLAIPSSRIRKAARVRLTDEIEDVLAEMQITGAHLALAANGHAAGVVFLEDIIEELVGEVRDSMQRRSL